MPQVMDCIEHTTQHFAALIQVMQIGAGEMFAGVTIASRIQRRIVLLMEGIADFQHARIDKQVAVARISGRHYAVEHVHTTAHAFNQIFWLANAH